MDITVNQEQARVPVAVFRIKGNIDSGRELEAEARKVFESNIRNILLDMSEVPYISSVGLRALHFIFMLLRTDDPNESSEAISKGITAGTYTSSHLKLLNPTPHVMEVLKMTGYDMFLEIHRDYKRAIASF